MIPVDIDNFNVKILSTFDLQCGIKIKYNSYQKIPKEIGNCSLLDQLYLSNYEITDISALSN